MSYRLPRLIYECVATHLLTFYFNNFRNVNLHWNRRLILRHFCKRSVYTLVDRKLRFRRWAVVYWIPGGQVRTSPCPPHESY